MSVKLTTAAKEKGTYIVRAVFTDEDGASVVPVTLNYSLKDLAGNYVNDVSGEVVAVPAATYDFVLSGNDLAIPSGGVAAIVLIIDGTYNSDAGIGLPIRESATVPIDNLEGVT